ncbi:MAG: DUF6798 domain-containing protein [Pyrinomonadaceae bacterium]
MKLPDFTNLKENFYLQFFALLGAVFVFVGKPVPYSNEFSYLLRLRKVYDPNYLANDLTFSTPANEYWLFDHIFGLLTFFLSIEMIGWLGRIACWSILLFALMRLGKRWEIPLWMTSVSIFLWLYVGQAVIADEWMLGDFEAKCVAYICLIFALERFSDKQDAAAAILLGLSFAFHPVVGLWAIAAAVPALLICYRDLRQTLKVAIIAGAFSLIGAIPLLQMRSASVEPTIENLKYFQLVKFPHHFDPFSWSRSAILLVFILMIFCLIVHAQIKNAKPPKFLITFLTILGVFFVFGILARVFSLYEIMKYTPTRLFAVFIPLFFFYYLSRAYHQNLIQKPFQIAVLLPVIILSLWNKIPLTGFYQMRSTYETWKQSPDDTADAFVWLKTNTERNAMIIAPPWRYDFWYLAERAEVVNFRKPIIADIGEWQNRLDDLTGKTAPENGFREDEELAKFYFGIDKETIDLLAAKYKADYFISESDYPYPVVYAKGKVKIFRLPSAR